MDGTMTRFWWGLGLGIVGAFLYGMYRFAKLAPALQEAIKQQNQVTLEQGKNLGRNEKRLEEQGFGFKNGTVFF